MAMSRLTSMRFITGHITIVTQFAWSVVSSSKKGSPNDWESTQIRVSENGRTRVQGFGGRK
eukprot:3941431-Rhodomonas_salina.3